MICGIDEAGRGSLVGPLVVAGVCFNDKNLKKIEQLGVKDSKMLSPKRRASLFNDIKNLADSYEIIEILPQEIDNRAANNKNLNTMEIDAFSKIITQLQPKEVYVDCVLRNPEKLKKELASASKARLIVEHKADENYPVVGAASILAKVMRDRAIKQLEEKHKVIIGSGYPSDATTVKFVEENIKKNFNFIRKTWAAYRKALERTEQTSLGNFK